MDEQNPTTDPVLQKLLGAASDFAMCRHDKVEQIKASLKLAEREAAEADAMLADLHAKFVGDSEPGDIEPEADPLRLRRTREEGTPRPEGLPTMPEMIVDILTVALRNGQTGLEGADIHRAVHERFWPGVAYDRTVPAAASMARDGRLEKDDKLFRLPAEHPARRRRERDERADQSDEEEQVRANGAALNGLPLRTMMEAIL